MRKNALKESKKIFSLRKLSVGLCSVALGTMLLIVQNTSVEAATTSQQQAETIKSVEPQPESNKAVQAENVEQEEKMTDNKAPKLRSAQEDEKIETVKADQPWAKIQDNKNTETQDVVTDHRQADANGDKKQESPSTLNDTVANKAKESDALNILKTQSTVQNNKKKFGEEATKKIEGKASTNSTEVSANPTNQWVIKNGKNYYYDAQGHQISNQWAAPTGTLHYFGSEGYTIENQWYSLDSGTYYFDENGHTVKNRWYTMPTNDTYYFDETGHTVKNRWYTMPTNDTYYFDNTGHTVKNRWYTMPTNDTYYFDENGHTVKNRWYTMPTNDTYYFDENGHTVKNRWYTMPTNDTYYFDENGHTVKNRWYTMPTNDTYYFDENGHTVKNRWYTMPTNDTYYFDKTGHTVKNRWYTMPTNDTYYFDKTGHTVKNRWYTMPTNDTYYFDKTGRTVKNRWYTMPDGSTCYFDNEGHTLAKHSFQHNTYVGIDPSTAELNVKIIGTGFIWIGNTGYSTDSDGKFTFNVSEYSGKYITVKIEPNEDWQVNSSETVYVPKLMFSNVSIKPNTREVSGNIIGTGDIWVKDSQGKETFQCRTGSDGKFTFDASRYAGESVTLEIKPNESPDSKTICSRIIKIPTLKFNYLSFNVDPDVPKISGDLNGDGAIWIKDSKGHEEFQCYTDHESFVLDASRYAGEDVTVEVKLDASPDSKVIVSESGHVISLPTISNLSIDPNTRMISGKVNRRSSIWVKEPNGKVTCVFGGVNDNFSFDANQYSGENITVGIGDSQPYYKYPISVPAITISNISVNPDKMKLSGKVNGTATVWVESPDGSEKSYGSYSKNFPLVVFDASKYSGENIIIKLRAGDTLDSRVMFTSEKVYVPSLTISDVSVNNLVLSGRVNGQADIYIKLPDGSENWEAFTDTGTYKFSIDVWPYKGKEIVIEAKPARGSRIITTKKVKIPLL